ncbi:MAG TPA: ABC transporter substrate-binding protein, partial [Candidatus Omnitrophota bacterium]|nr:ABC transporter substrate-binding protein [Candidatus Omnitrophota bacterium]
QEWVGYGPFYLAQEKGFFVQDGIEVFFIDEELDSNRRDAFKAGILDCEVGTIDLLVSKRAQNTPVIAVLELDCSFGGDAIVADKSIKSLNDLIGKRIVFSRDDVSETFISYLFHKKGLSLKDISIITRPPDKVADVFLGKEAEAVVTWEPWVTRALARPGAHILVSTRQTPEVIIDTLNVREDFLKNNPQAVSALMRGWFKAIEYLKDHPEEGSRIIARHYKITPLAYRQSIERLKWIGYKEQIDPSQAKARKEIFDLIAQLKFNNGRISKLPDSENSFDSVLIRKIYENSQ